MQHQHHPDIDAIFHYKCIDSNLILVVNSDNYVMAEYRRGSGKITWQRIVNVSQRERVEKWLVANYPTDPISTPRKLPAVRILKRTARK
jgi:hypothetical protein